MCGYEQGYECVHRQVSAPCMYMHPVSANVTWFSCSRLVCAAEKMLPHSADNKIKAQHETAVVISWRSIRAAEGKQLR